MKKLILAGLTLSIGLSLYAFAAQDYTRLKKDVGVMNQIVNSAFRADGECRGCKIDVQGKYLADQGFLFIVSSGKHIWINSHDLDFSGYSYYFDDEDLADLEFIPGMVSNIVNGVIAAVPGAPDAPEVVRRVEIIDDSTRSKLREVRQDRRNLEQKIRENEIELIHAEDEERDTIRARVREVQAEVAKLEGKEAEIKVKVAAAREEVRKEREEKRLQRERALATQQKLVEAKVLQAFCDYGSTLRSLPDPEKVTIIFEDTQRDPEADTIYVFDRDDVVECDRGENSMKEKALTYMF